MERYWHENMQDCVETDSERETFTTYTSGTREPLYSGRNERAARESLEWDEETWNRIMISDPEFCDITTD